MFKSLSRAAAGVVFLVVASTASADSIFLGGIEDYVGGTGFEGSGDYNDLIFQMAGKLSVLAPQAAFYALTPDQVNEAGTVFWDQHSGDGPLYNVGYCVTGLGNCLIPGLTPPLGYLAGAGGTAPPSELFQASGTVTASLLLEKTSNYNVNTLGWYDPAHPGVLHQIFAGPDSAGATVTFTPSATFALYSTNGFGQFYSSVAANNQQELLTQQHFALFSETPIATPEPATAWLAGVVLAAGVRRMRRGQKPGPLQ